ncbi:MAG: methyl-accepting chemotaxis protein [Zoogloeaceae bacterium]|jgi:aerotaxis receptor|nr:methyl-accepting chemotaxis protein [Zoogloeaceae bacterium]
MKKNLPVTQRETPLPPGRYIVSRTDLKGVITYVNDTFVELSGFGRDELVGRSHNIVRHPDMPPQAFANLWATVKAGLPWRGLVKNRCKNGDHYWVDALIVPVRKNSETIGYMSVRTEPDQARVRAAEARYQDLNATGQGLPGPGKAPLSLRGRLIGLAAFLVILQLAANFLELFGGVMGGWIGHFLGLLGVFAGILLVRWQRQALDGMADATRLMDRIAQGDLTDAIPGGRRDELGRMYDAMTVMQAHLKVMLAEIDEAARRIGNDAVQLENAMGTIHGESFRQSESVGHIAANVEELSTAATEVASGAEETASAVRDSHGALERAVQRMHDGRQASRRVVDTVQQAGQIMRQLSDAIRQIDTVSGGILEIAGQTNLLALNATIEAARAGEAGRGFAVVADEVKKLAERAGERASEISRTVAEIQGVTQEALAAMEQAGAQVDDTEQAMNQSDAGLKQVADKGRAVSEMAGHIARSAAEESQTTGDIAAHLTRISDGIEENVGHLETVRQGAVNLTQVAGELKTLISYFHFNQRDTRRPTNEPQVRPSA